MKKTNASWCTIISLDADCPHCESTNDLYDGNGYDLWESINGEFDEDSCDGMEFECDGCGKTFGLNSINAE